VVPKVPIILEEHRVAITPFANKFRLGSTMEFAGYDESLNRKRLNFLKSAAAVYLREPYAEPVEEEWFGWRPMTWDGKPVVDRVPSLENVWIAAGHNMLGLSMAPATGKLLQELLDGHTPHIDPRHYSLKRF
jgi:D-amino-acid dehydrogenase